MTESLPHSEPGSILRAVDRGVLVAGLLLLGGLASGAVALRRRLSGA